MKLSETFTTTKPAAGRPESVNADLLQRGGFIDQTAAGIYSFLPLGLRVLNRIADSVRREMNQLQAQELWLPVMHPKSAWQQTGRWEAFNALYRLQDSSKKEFALGPTHEEIITPLARRQMTSYRDFPQAVYQIQTKFRDEPRPRGGLLRGREFLMKDMYSFHLDAADLDRFYQQAIAAYQATFAALGLETQVVEASGGDFTQDFSHEFQVFCEAGEDTVLYCAKGDFAQNKEIAQVKAGEKCPVCGSPIRQTNGIEVGNIFKLGDRFSRAVGFSVNATKGEEVFPVMGCYGIGISRLMAAIVEVCHDEHGIIWPASVAPAQVHLLSLGDDRGVVKAADQLYQQLQAAGVEVIYDDRSETAGVKFSDADLIGAPVRLTVSAKTLEQQAVEQKARGAAATKLVPLAEIVASLATT